MINTERRDFKQGDIIIFCNEEFEVLENYGHSGKVKEVLGDAVINPFYLVFGKDECKLKSN
jgi:hypothetical protein